MNESTDFWESRRCPDCRWYMAHDIWCPQLRGGAGEQASK